MQYKASEKNDLTNSDAPLLGKSGSLVRSVKVIQCVKDPKFLPILNKFASNTQVGHKVLFSMCPSSIIQAL